MKRKQFLSLLLVICIFGGLLRIYKINNPIADWHSWRQVDTAAVARNFIKSGIDPLHPKYDDLSNIQSGKDNPEGLRMVEFPVYQLLGVTIYKLFTGISIEVALRIISILASVGSIALVGLLGKKTGNSIIGLASAFFYAILPYNVYYGRTILPEPLMVFCYLSALYLACLSIEYKQFKKYFLLITSGVMVGIALLLKPFAVFFLLPLPYFFVVSLGVTWTGIIISIISFAVSVIPFFLWRKWIAQFPEGIPAYTWLFNEGNIRLKGAWFHWLFAERIGKLILGYWGISFLTVGLVKRREMREALFIFLSVIGVLAYFVVIARGNVQHDYYQIPIIPVIALLLGKGAEWFIHPPKDWGRFTSRIVGLCLIAFLLSFSWFEIRGYYWINHQEIIDAGKTADAMLPADAKVIAPYNGDTTFLYQTNRQGWPIGFEIDKKIKMGATYYVTVSPSDNDGETKDLASRYTVLVRNDKFAIIDLTKPKFE